MYNFNLKNEIIIVVRMACFLFSIISPIYRGERVGVYQSFCYFRINLHPLPLPLPLPLPPLPLVLALALDLALALALPLPLSLPLPLYCSLIIKSLPPGSSPARDVTEVFSWKGCLF